LACLERDRPSIKPSDRFSGREILRSIRSPHVIINGTCLFGLALFLPSIVSELGIRHNYLVLGHSPWGFRCVCSLNLSREHYLNGSFLNLVILISSYVSDRYQSRGIAVTLITTLAVAGYSIHLGNSILQRRSRGYPE